MGLAPEKCGRQLQPNGRSNNLREQRIMRIFTIALLSCSLVATTALSAPPRRTVDEIPGGREALSRMVSPKFYRSLLISPVAGWVVVRGQLAANRVSGATVVHSEMGGAYDKL